MLLGLVLVDPPQRNTFFIDERGQERDPTPIIIRSEPFQGGYHDFTSTGVFSDSSYNNVYGPPQSSLLDDVVYYWMNEFLPLSLFDPQSPTLLSISYYPLQVLVAEWMNFANLMLFSIENLEDSTSTLSVTASELGVLESNVRELQSWRRRTTDSVHRLHNFTDTIRSHLSTDRDSEPWESLLDDIAHVVTRIEIYGRRFEAILPVLTSFVQIVESRRSFAEAKSITQLSYLVLIFVPLTFVSGLFSMSGDLEPGKQGFWIYFAVAIPLVVIVFLIARRNGGLAFRLPSWLNFGL